jgi:CheY-like chemotaxis protein
VALSGKAVRKRILVVDDDAEARKMLKLLLSLDQHTVVEAENGRMACLTYTPGDFDLILTDYDMPEMKGDELARTIKCLVPRQRIIMITGVPWKLGGQENPVDAVLITLDELRRFISTVLSTDLEKYPFRFSKSASGHGMGLGLT